ncbi:NCS2 family permease [Coraliomargarita parva]|uniref:NCS2 family permease n=1 Tax=Coraliomargarita parva TaxID=3014050 RepID=UPI0022B2C5A9|nr:NCS2 family permease [Coraliomargarita parva]
MLSKFFQFEAHGTTMGREIMAGVTTFAAMAYILVVNPLILGNAGMDTQAVIMATGLAAALGCFLMAFMTNYPIALAPGMGTNAYFAFIIVLGMGMTWQAALSLTFWNGIIFLILSITGFRKRLAEAIPAGLQVGIQAGIGFFIALLGLKAAGIVESSPATIITHGDITAPHILLAFAGLFLMCVLSAKKIPGAILLSMVALAILGFFVAGPDGAKLTSAPEGVVDMPSGLGKTFAQLEWLYPFQHPASFKVLFVLLILDLFDSLGTIIGVSRRAKLVDEDGKLPKMDKALTADAMATIGGAVLGTSTTTSFVESAAGIEAGGRTGLTSIVVGTLFLLSLFFHPLIVAVPAIATAPALIFVGLLMGQSLRDIPYDDYTETLTAIFTAIAIPLFFSITHGLAIGMILFLFMRLATGRIKEVNSMTFVIGAIFVAFYAIG